MAATRRAREGVGAFIAGYSSMYSTSYTPERAIDYDTNSYWCSANGQPNDQWFTVGLIEDGPYLVDRVGMRGYSGGYSPKDFQVRVSATTTDTASFTTVVSATLPSDGQWHWFTFPPTPARYVQFFVRNNYGDAFSCVYDFRVYSPELGGALVPFDDLSVDRGGRVTAWRWDFGDGSQSAEQHPLHMFPAPACTP